MSKRFERPTSPGYWWYKTSDGRQRIVEVTGDCRHFSAIGIVKVYSVDEHPGEYQPVQPMVTGQPTCPICKAPLDIDRRCKPCGMDYEELFGQSTWEGFEG